MKAIAKKVKGKLKFQFDPKEIRVKVLIQSFAIPITDSIWEGPLTVENVILLEQLGFQLSDVLQRWKSQQNAPKAIRGLKKVLRPFQSKGVGFIHNRGGRGIIGDEMGLGKTVQTLAFLQYHPELRSALIVCPATLKGNWKKEILQWMSDVRVVTLEGQKPKTIRVDDKTIIIINYEIISFWVKELTKLKPAAMVLDEFQKIKNPKTKRTKACNKVGKLCGSIIGLSGTPVMNRPIELYPILNLIDPNAYGNYYHFCMRYGKPRKTPWGWKFNGVSHAKELHSRLKEVMIRRKKEDVLPELPDIAYSIVSIQMEDFQAYREAELGIVRSMGDGTKLKRSQVQASMEHLIQMISRGKLKACISWIEDFLESGEKLVIFAHHIDIVESIYKHFQNVSVKINGSTPTNKRQGLVESFQKNDAIRLFIGNIVAASEGITLTAASNVVFIEYSWVPSQLDQALARVHRMGQTARGVTCWNLVVENTVEQKMLSVLNAKRRVVNQVVDGKDADTKDVVMEVFAEFCNSSSSKSE